MCILFRCVIFQAPIAFFILFFFITFMKCSDIVLSFFKQKFQGLFYKIFIRIYKNIMFKKNRKGLS